MSGGVDSSVAAALLVEQGCDAIGVTLRLLPKLDSSFGCCGSPRDIDDAKRVCERLGIPHYVLDLAKRFDRDVVTPFVDRYRDGLTPNPCVECNRSLKFGYLLDLAGAWGAEAVATGHYARAEEGRLYRAVDAEKDQTYFLHGLTRRQLGRVRFPLGRLRKPQVRARARALGLATAEKPESQEICFVGGRDYRGFVASRAGSPPEAGDVADASGRVLGRHAGLTGYTVGQRRGLGELERPGGSEREPLYVVGLVPATNTVVVGPRTEVFRSGLLAGAVTWTRDAPGGPFEAEVRIRHRHPPAPALVSPLEGGRVRVEFREPQRAVAPGQSAVFYRGDEVLGGGAILEAI
ncbi:MAG: tRNA 2-thiouridine(34) synthase MnmA [Elusimicrobia bacterium]|nr:tRNA 2-thiouridine(34) synthase MnmA [Elusimicrobiota bacterium]